MGKPDEPFYTIVETYRIGRSGLMATSMCIPWLASSFRRRFTFVRRSKCGAISRSAPAFAFTRS